MRTTRHIKDRLSRKFWSTGCLAVGSGELQYMHVGFLLSYSRTAVCKFF